MCSDEQLDKIKAVIEKSYYVAFDTRSRIVSSTDDNTFSLQSMQEITNLARVKNGVECYFEPITEP